MAASRRISADPARVFALALNTELFPSLFPGFGPIPAVLSVERLEDGPLVVGSQRRVRSSDGGELHEQVLELVDARQHRYAMRGFCPPVSWWVQAAEADWHFTPSAEGTKVRWEYRFAVRGRLARLLVALLAHLCFRPAMRRCLERLAHVSAASH